MDTDSQRKPDSVSSPDSAETAERLAQEQLEGQRRFLNSMFAGFSELIYLVDRQKCFVFMNKALQQLQGITGQPYAGKPLSFIMPSKELARQVEQHIETVFQTGQTIIHETQATSLTGKTGYYEYIFNPVADVAGKVEFVVGISRDITERKHREAHLDFLTGIGDDFSRLSSPNQIMNAVGEKLFKYAGASRLTFSNVDEDADTITAIYEKRATGLEKTALLPQQLSTFFSVTYRQEFNAGRVVTINDIYTDPRTAALAEAYQAWGVVAQLHVPFTSKGSWCFVITVNKDQPYQWRTDEIDFLREISSRLYLRLKRAQAEEALKLADRRKDEFLAMLAHELRNPLTPISTILQILPLTIGHDVTVSPMLAIMNRQVDHLVRLVDDLLDVSRISRGSIRLRWERIELSALIKQAVDAVLPYYQDQYRQLQLTLPPFGIYLNGDATRLTQVVTNLLTNGVRYTSVNGQVWVSLEQQHNKAVIRVRDNGIGLTVDQMSTIFDLFVQVDNSLARPQGGLGVGLTLVQKLVEQHGGRVEVYSRGLGQGSEFVVYLPVVEEQEKSTDKMKESGGPIVSGYRILVIDDNQDAAMTLSMLLRLKGYEVHTRYTGEAGINAFITLRPMVVLLDIGMPELDGYETCRLIRQQTGGHDAVLIALTGYGQEEDKQRSLAAGFNGHLIKPVMLDTLLQMLTDLVPPGHTG